MEFLEAVHVELAPRPEAGGVVDDDDDEAGGLDVMTPLGVVGGGRQVGRVGSGGVLRVLLWGGGGGGGASLDSVGVEVDDRVRKPLLSRQRVNYQAG